VVNCAPAAAVPASATSRSGPPPTSSVVTSWSLTAGSRPWRGRCRGWCRAAGSGGHSPCAHRGAEPLGVVVACGAVEQFVVECPGARPGPRASIGEDGDQGHRRDAHAAGLRESSAPVGFRRLRAVAGLSSLVRTRQVTSHALQWLRYSSRPPRMTAQARTT
jgi:hypothetical protein